MQLIILIRLSKPSHLLHVKQKTTKSSLPRLFHHVTFKLVGSFKRLYNLTSRNQPILPSNYHPNTITMAVGVRLTPLSLPSPNSMPHPPTKTHPQRSAATKIDWTRITSSLGLKGSTATSLQAFKKRNDDARRKLALLHSQPTSVDFSQYRSTLNNTAVVDEIQGHFSRFKPATYDVGRQLKAIEAFEGQAVKSAEETKGRVDEEVRALEKTLGNIETARPFDELTVVCCSDPGQGF